MARNDDRKYCWKATLGSESANPLPKMRRMVQGLSVNAEVLKSFVSTANGTENALLKLLSSF